MDIEIGKTIPWWVREVLPMHKQVRNDSILTATELVFIVVYGLLTVIVEPGFIPRAVLLPIIVLSIVVPTILLWGSYYVCRLFAKRKLERIWEGVTGEKFVWDQACFPPHKVLRRLAEDVTYHSKPENLESLKERFYLARDIIYLTSLWHARIRDYN